MKAIYNKAGKLVAGSLMAGAIAAAISGPAHAQKRFLMEEIIVTATKREASLQHIPVTVSAITAETIQQAGVVNVEDVAQLVPTLTISRNLNPFATAMRIRGIGTSQNDPSLEPSVAFIVDGAYMGRSGLGMSDLTDIERVEVLHGPQGTLYGKNSNAGVISVVTKRPNMDEYEGFVEATVGDYDLTKIVAAASGPIVENLAFRVSGSWHEADGYIENDAGEDQNSVDDWNIRGKLLWEPLDELSITLTASHVDRDTTCCAADAILAEPTRDELARQDFNVPKNDAFDYDIATDVSNEFDLESDSAFLNIDYVLDWAVFTSLTSWSDYDYTTSTDADRSELDVISIIDDTFTGESWSQEFRLTSDIDGPLEYLVGLYYLDDDVTRNEDQAFAFLGDDLLKVNPGLGAIAQPGDVIIGGSKWNTEAFAVFGQSKYNFTEDLSLTVGLRYTDEEKEADLETSNFSSSIAASIPGVPTLVDLIATPIDAQLDRQNDDVNYLASLQYFITPDVMIFAGTATGTKSGGFNGVSGEFENRSYDEEDSTNYEVGIKSKLFDQKLQLNATMFYSEFEDLQFLQQQASGAGQIVSNAAEAETKGVDLGITALPLPNLILDAGIQYLDAEYTDGVLENFDVVYAPDWSGNLAATLFFPLADGQIYMRTDYAWMGDHFSNPTYQPSSAEQDRETLNARLGWKNNHWDISAWVKNATDDDYSSLSAAPLAITDMLAEFLVPPRTYGATLRYTF